MKFAKINVSSVSSFSHNYYTAKCSLLDEVGAVTHYSASYWRLRWNFDLLAKQSNQITGYALCSYTSYQVSLTINSSLDATPWCLL